MKELTHLSRFRNFPRGRARDLNLGCPKPTPRLSIIMLLWLHPESGVKNVLG